MKNENGAPSLVIFDFDGIILDSEGMNYQANELTFNPYGLSFTLEEYADLWVLQGLDLEDIVERYGLKVDPEVLRAAKNAYCAEIMKTDVPPLISGVRELIADLLKENLKLAIGSSNSFDTIQKLLTKHALEHAFSIIIGKEHVKKSKPDPEAFLHCLALTEADPANAVVIEDAPKGIIAARRAGIGNIIAVPNVWTRKGDFSTAHSIADSMEQVFPLIFPS